MSYYRAVMKSDAARSDEGAVGSHTHESWLKIGQMQFDYLVSHGLKPGMRMLEIGCGNLRAGRLFIDYLDAGDYYGIDISPDILLAAQRTLAEVGLQDKLPHLTLVQDLKLAFLPAGHFDVVHAHSVFSHSPIEIIEECLAHVGRVMKPDGFFDFTFDRTEGAEHQVLREDFYYRTETLVGAGRPARPDRTIHDRLGRTSASAIQAAHHPASRVTIHLDRLVGLEGNAMEATDGDSGVPEVQGASEVQETPGAQERVSEVQGTQRARGCQDSARGRSGRNGEPARGGRRRRRAGRRLLAGRRGGDPGFGPGAGRRGAARAGRVRRRPAGRHRIRRAHPGRPDRPHARGTGRPARRPARARRRRPAPPPRLPAAAPAGSPSR